MDDLIDIRDVVRRTGLTSRALRFSEARGLVAPLRTQSGRRLSMGVRMAAMEQHLAANQVEIARLSGDVAQIKTDILQIKRRLALVEA